MVSLSRFKAALAVLALTTLPAHAAIVSAETTAQKNYEYNFQSPYAGPHILNTRLYMPWMEELKDKSGNRLRLNYFMSGALVRSGDVRAIMDGNLDLGGVSPQNEEALFPHTLTFMLPYIARDSVQASELYWQAYNSVPEVKTELDKIGKILTVWGSDRSGLFSASGPILSPADLKGKKVLIWSEGQIPQVQAWGATPVLVSGLDTRRALQRGAGDVFFGPLPAGVAYKVKEAASDITVLPAANLLLFTAVSWNTWNELPADLQKLLTETTGHEASILSGKLLYDATNEDLAAMERDGIQIHMLTDAQVAAFSKADAEATVKAWEKKLQKLGVADPEKIIRQAYQMAASTPDAKGRQSHD